MNAFIYFFSSCRSLLNFLHQELILTFPPAFRDIAIHYIARPLAADIIRIEKVPVLSHEDRCVGWSLFESTEGTLRVQSGVLPLS